jgi:hypothetical protein
MFGPKREGVTQDWKKSHNKELHDAYSSPKIIPVFERRRIR